MGVAEELPEASVALHSSTGEIDIGTASVDPSGGPVGTVHTVLVEVSSDYSDDIDRVTVRTDSGDDIGEDEFDLDADSTGEGIWLIELSTVGKDGDTRTDTLTFRLWQAVEEESDAG